MMARQVCLFLVLCLVRCDTKTVLQDKLGKLLYIPYSLFQGVITIPHHGQQTRYWRLSKTLGGPTLIRLDTKLTGILCSRKHLELVIWDGDKLLIAVVEDILYSMLAVL
ncbi:unnamed protein product [Colias eurytheme]|nr:unnamed protein product [Colias eurytheme]